MATIEKRGEYWTVRWRFAGRQHRHGRIPSQATAKTIARQVEDATARGVLWIGDTGAGATLAEAVAAYVEDRARIVAKATLSRESGSLARFQDDHPDRLDVVDTDAIERWHGKLLQRMSPLSANHEARAIDGFARWCLQRRQFRDGVGDLRDLRLPYAAPQLVPDAPSWGEMDAAIHRATGWYRDLAIVMRCTGLRSQQAMHLRRGNVDLRALTITIPPSLPGSKSRAERRGRVVPLSRVLADELAAWGAWSPDLWLIDRTHRTASGYVAGADKRHPIEPTPMRNAWRATGIRATAWRQPLHCFRKGFVTGLASAGVPDELRKYLVGHSGGVHADTYTVWTLLEDRLREAVAIVPPITRGVVLALAAVE